MSLSLSRRALLACAAMAPAFASETRPLFRLERISKRCWAALANPWILPNGNSVIFVGDRSVAVVDAQSSRVPASALIRQIREVITTQPIQHLILTHHHLDHAHGATAHTDVEIISTRATRRLLVQERAWIRQYASGNMPSVAESDELKGYYDFLDAALLRHGKQKAAEGDRDWQAYFKERSTEDLHLPTLTFDGGLHLDLGDLEIQAIAVGPAHTAGDLVVYAPGEKVIATGDVLHGFDPLFFEADLVRWPAALDRIAALPYEAVVPAHGSVQRERRWSAHFKQYVVELRDRVGDGLTKGVSLDELQRDITPSTLQALGDGYGVWMQAQREQLLGAGAGTLDDAVRYAVQTIYARLKESRPQAISR